MRYPLPENDSLIFEVFSAALAILYALFIYYALSNGLNVIFTWLTH